MNLQAVFASTDPLGRALRACRPHFMAVAVFSAFLNLLYLAPTLYMLQVYDRVLPTSGRTTLVMVSLALLFALVSLACLDWVRTRILVRCGARLDQELSRDVLTQLLAQRNLSRVDRSRLVRDFDSFRAVIAGSGVLAAFDAPWTPIYILAAFLLHPALGLLCVVASLAMLGLAWLNEQVSARALTEANAVSAQAYARQDHVSAWAAETRAFGMVEALVNNQLLERSKVSRLAAEANFASGHVGAIIKFLRMALQSAALGFAAWLAIDGKISAGSLMAASFLLARALAPVEQVVGAWKGIVRARDAYGALRKLFADAAPDDAARTQLPDPRGEMALETVTVATPDGERSILADLSFRFEAGETVGLVGPSGSGKSTLLRVLAGALQPTTGTVRVDGAARHDWSAERLARHIGYLPQEFVMFPGTVKENISRFRGYVDGHSAEIDAMTVAAAKAAGAHEIILRLPQGYDTVLGLGAVNLSLGQTQRVALARALFGAPRMVLLDEPNSHLDAEGEGILCDTLRRLRAEGVTVIIAAHRGAVLGSAHKVVILNGGRIQGVKAVAASPPTAPPPVQAGQISDQA